MLRVNGFKLLKCVGVVLKYISSNCADTSIDYLGISSWQQVVSKPSNGCGIFSKFVLNTGEFTSWSALSCSLLWRKRWVWAITWIWWLGNKWDSSSTEGSYWFSLLGCPRFYSSDAKLVYIVGLLHYWLVLIHLR